MSELLAYDLCFPASEDIVQLRAEIARRREAYQAGRRRFRQGEDFTSEHRRWATRRIGEEKGAMKLEEQKLKQLDERLENLMARHRRRCGGEPGVRPRPSGLSGRAPGVAMR